MKKILVTKILVLFFLFILGGTVNASTFSISTSSSTFSNQCNSELPIIIDATSEKASSAEVIINYDTSKLDIIDTDSQTAGIQISEGDAFKSYVYNLTNTSTGEIRLAGITLGSNYLSSKKTFGKIVFKPKASSGSTNLTIKFSGVGNTLDTNVADFTTSLDTLKSVTNATISFSSNDCVVDRTGPSIEMVSLSREIKKGDKLKFKISDTSDVDLSNSYFIFNGEIFQTNSSNVTYESTDSGIIFTFTLSKDLPADMPASLVIYAVDKEGNKSSKEVIFNEKMACTTNEDVEKACNDIVSSAISGLVEDSIASGTVKSIVDDSGVAGLFGGLSLVLLSLNLAYLFTAPSLILKFLGILLGRKNHQSIGVVYDSVTKAPISMATCIIYLKESEYEVERTLTDFEGKYGFLLNYGEYRLIVKKPGYKTIEKEISYSDTYSSLNFDIELSPEYSDVKSSVNFLSAIKDELINFYLRLSNVLFVIGLFVSTFAVILKPSVFNVVTFVTYILILGLLIFQKTSKSNKFATITNSTNNLGVPFAIIKVFDSTTNQLITTEIANRSGRFDIKGINSGVYSILVVAKGFLFPSKYNTHPITGTSYYSLIQVNLTNGGNNFNVLLDPTNMQMRSENKLNSPFSSEA